MCSPRVCHLQGLVTAAFRQLFPPSPSSACVPSTTPPQGPVPLSWRLVISSFQAPGITSATTCH